MGENNKLKGTVEELFRGMDGVISSKTVVGDAIHIGDTIILPLIDVSFGMGAGSFSGEKKEKHVIDTTKCLKCGACMEKCKKHAIEKR